MEAGRYAPTAGNLQQLEYRVVTNKKLLQRMSDIIVGMMRKENPSFQLKEGRDSIFYKAPTLIIIIGPKKNEWIGTDAALAIQNIMLYSTSIDLGTCIMGSGKFIERNKEIMNELNIDEDKRIAAMVICGYPDENPPEKEKKLNVKFIE